MSASPEPRRPDRRALDREILALAIPAFATLVAEPLLLMADSAIIGHLATSALAGLGIATSVVGLVIGLSIFLAYGTTSSVARRIGAGDPEGALAEGLDGISLGLLVGIVVGAAVSCAAGPIIGLYGVDSEVAAPATTYLRIVALGFPAALTMLAATGVLRGLQDTRTPLYVAVAMNLVNIALNLILVLGLGLGIAGAAIGTVCSQASAATFLAGRVIIGARRAQVVWRWNPGGVLRAARTGGWLVVRTLGLQASILTTTTVAARMGATAMAAHQILNSLWQFLMYAMDAIAIAAQAIVGRYLGARQPVIVSLLMKRMLTWGFLIGLALSLGLWLAHPLYLGIFTPDPAVAAQVARVLALLAVITPFSAAVFVLDGVLIGAGDTRYLAGASIINFLSYLPLALAVAFTGAGLVWLWAAYAGFLLSRAITLGLRARGTAWMRLGA